MTGEDQAERDADRRARELVDRLRDLPSNVQDPRDLVVVVEGATEPWWTVPPEWVDAVLLLCGPTVAHEVAALECRPGAVRVLVILSGGWMHVTSLGLRVLQRGGVA